MAGKGEGLCLGPQKRFKLSLDASRERKRFQTDNLSQMDTQTQCVLRALEKPLATAGKHRGFHNRQLSQTPSRKAQAEFRELRTPLTGAAYFHKEF